MQVIKKSRILFSTVVVFSIFFSGLLFYAQDIVSNEDLSLGSSVFVFRKSRKAPQSRAASRKYFYSSTTRTASNRFTNKKLTAKYRRNSNVARAKSNNPPTLRANAKNKLSNALTAQGDAFMKTGEFDKAIAKYKEALKNNAQNQTAKTNLSQANMAKADELFDAGDSIEAKVFYQESANLDQTNYPAFIKLGLIEQESKLPDEALGSYEKALKIKADLPELFVPVATLYLEKGDTATAENYLVKAEKVSGNEADVTFLRGLIYRKQGANDKALAAFDKTLEIDPSRSEVYFYQAEIYEQTNKQTEAIAAYEKTVEAEPENSEAWFDLGVANYNQGKYEAAAEAYNKTIALDAKNPEAHASLASVYRQMEKYPEANAQYKLAAETIKDDADLYSEWGFCLGKVDEWDKAVARLQTARDLSPDSIDYSNLGWGYYNAAQKDSDDGNKDAAEAKYEQGKTILLKAVELNPKFDAAHLNLGITYTGLGDYKNAVDTLTKANNLHRNWLVGINELGVAYRKMDNLNQAISQFERAVNLDDKFALGYFNLGEAQSKLGRKKEAKKTLERLKQLDPQLANKLDRAIKGAILDETKDQIRRKIPRLPF